MKRLGLVAMVLALVLGSTTAWADFYVISGGGPPVGTKITTVPYTISTPGFYYFGKNLTFSGGTDTVAITISADDVTLDLMGFSLTNGGGNFPRGIYMNGRSNVEIRNGTVGGFKGGVYEASDLGSKHRVINVRAANNRIDGIRLEGNNHQIKNCNSSNTNSGYGIWLHSGVISGCNASYNPLGIGLRTGIVTECYASNNNKGIFILGQGNVLGNTAFNNSENNFYFGNGVATAIMADRNSAFGLSTNYYVYPGTTGIRWGVNAGTP